ncbi:MAG: hypothetical protein WC285_03180 [Candidatus Gracilibacteria bacterium]
MTTLVLGGCLEKLTGGEEAATDDAVTVEETTAPVVEPTTPAADETAPAEVPAE